MRKRFLLLAIAPISCRPAPEPAIDAGPPAGRQIYMARCVSCHQIDGGGVPSICPPLQNSPLLAGKPDDLIRVLLLGTKGRVTRGGSDFAGIMPAWKFDFTDGQIAEVINDLYARWNPAAPRVTEETVRRAREQTASQNLFPPPKTE